MAAIGCLIPLVLMIIGAVAGSAIGGRTVGVWGGAIGVVVGVAAMLLMWWLFERAKNLPE